MTTDDQNCKTESLIKAIRSDEITIRNGEERRSIAIARARRAGIRAGRQGRSRRG